MNVYFNSSLWGYKKGLCGLPQKVNWEFEYAGNKHIIPFLYRFSKGIVFDIITVLDEKGFKEFYDKYETLEEKLTPSQRRCAEQEHPYQPVQIKEIFINGSQVEDGFSSSSSIYIPWLEEKDVLKPVKKAYSSILKDGECFACERYCIQYPKTDSKIKKILRLLRLDGVDRLKLLTHPMNWFFPLDINFEMTAQENQKEVSFEHPKTGIKHILYFQKGEILEFSINLDKEPNIYAVQSSYQVVPPLPEGDTLQFNNNISYTIQNKYKYTPTSTASIGIIGGADGPTSIFFSSSKGTCLSVPSFEKTDKAQFVIEGINTKKVDSKVYNFFKK